MWLGHVLRMRTDRLPQYMLFSETGIGWKVSQGGRLMMWEKCVKSLTNGGLVQVHLGYRNEVLGIPQAMAGDDCAIAKLLHSRSFPFCLVVQTTILQFTFHHFSVYSLLSSSCSEEVTEIRSDGCKGWTEPIHSQQNTKVAVNVWEKRRQ